MARLDGPFQKLEIIMTIFTSKGGQPITQAMLCAAMEAARDHNIIVSVEQVRTVLDVGLPYSMRTIPAAAEPAGIDEWLADLMGDYAIAAIE